MRETGTQRKVLPERERAGLLGTIPMLNCPHCEQDLTPHEIGVLYAAVGRTQSSNSRRFWGAKLTRQEINLIHKSEEPTRTIAERYNVSIWRVKKNKTYKAQNELNCPHCGHKLTPKEIGRLFATLGGSTSSPRKAKAAIVNGRKAAKLTEKDVANIRKSKIPMKDLAKKYKVRYDTIAQIRRNEIWKTTPSE